MTDTPFLFAPGEDITHAKQKQVIRAFMRAMTRYIVSSSDFGPDAEDMTEDDVKLQVALRFAPYTTPKHLASRGWRAGKRKRRIREDQ